MSHAASTEQARLLAAVEALLPQTQCRRCGYAGCGPYAQALIGDGESVALCPPGGETTRQQLATLLQRDDDVAALVSEPARVAAIREIDCIGCTQCLDACPVDAIIGAAGRMHTVFTLWCTGCELCVPVCPTDCIEMPAAERPLPDAEHNRVRYAARLARLDGRHTARRVPALVEVEAEPDGLRATILAAVARKRGVP